MNKRNIWSTFVIKKKVFYENRVIWKPLCSFMDHLESFWTINSKLLTVNLVGISWTQIIVKNNCYFI